MKWSERPTSPDLLVEMGRAESIGHLDENLRHVARVVVDHIDAHKRAVTRNLAIAGFAFTVLAALIGFGMSEFRGRTTAEAMRQCEKTASDKVVAAKSEHGELRAADQRIAEAQVKLGRELQALAQWRLEQRRKARPR